MRKLGDSRVVFESFLVVGAKEASSFLSSSIRQNVVVFVVFLLLSSTVHLG
jgi:hypothetical protein